MPSGFKKKGREGGKRSEGRPATKGVGFNGSSMSEERKAEYYRETKAKYRNQTTPPEARGSGDGGGAGEGRGRRGGGVFI